MDTLAPSGPCGAAELLADLVPAMQGFMPGMALNGAGIFIDMAFFSVSPLLAGSIVTPGMVWASVGNSSATASIAAKKIFDVFMACCSFLIRVPDIYCSPAILRA